MPKNETGHMLHGRLQVTSGTFSGGAQLHVVTGADFAFQAGQFTIQPDGTFGTATLDLTNPSRDGEPGAGSWASASRSTPATSARTRTRATPVVFNIDTVVD